MHVFIDNTGFILKAAGLIVPPDNEGDFTFLGRVLQRAFSELSHLHAADGFALYEMKLHLVELIKYKNTTICHLF